MDDSRAKKEDPSGIKEGEEKVRILVDHREKPSGILEILETCHVETKVCSLRAGDYIVNDFAAVERKEARDFLISIIDNRLFTQASRMRKYCENPLFLIEGDIYKTDIDFDPRAIRGGLVSVCAVWKIPVLYTGSIEETAEVLVTLGKQEYRQASHLVPRTHYRHKRLKSRQLFFLQGLPLIGPKMAWRLLEHFGSASRAVNATEDELLQVKGIGKETAGRIQEVLKSPFDS